MKYEFDRNKTPVFEVEPGESFSIETEDAASGYINEDTKAEDVPNLPYFDSHPPKANPVSGPVYIKGAEKGDLLVVSIEKIQVAAKGWTIFLPGSGPLGDSKSWSKCSEPFLQWIEHRDGKAYLNEDISWDLDPMIGTIGVAPERQVKSTIWGQGPWGGNLDCRDMREGTKFYTTCYNDGGLLFVGDVHGSQGDTEFTGTANETAAEVTLSCEIIKDKTIPFCRLETDNSYVSLFSSRPLEDAVKKAIINLMDWMVSEYGVEEEVAYMYPSINPDFKIEVYQMVNLGEIGYTVGAKLPKKYFKGQT